MYIQRHIESVLKQLMEQFPALLITGPRQVGKSTLLQHAAPEYDYVSFDDPLLLTQAKEEPNLFVLNHTEQAILDEVQYAPELFSLLKLHIDKQNRNGMYLLLESQAFELMHNVSVSLTDRESLSLKCNRRTLMTVSIHSI